MKDFLKRSLAFVLAFLMVFGLLPATGWKEPVVKTALAAEGDPFTLKEFQTCYGKVLLSMVGRGYDAGGSASGYYVGGTYYSGQSSRVTSGTPYHPLTINGTSNDCYGLVITALMAMGYDCFSDQHGHTYPFNAYYGGGIFDPNTSSNSIFRYNGTGDILTLHHSNNEKYTIHFEIGEIINKGSDWGGKDEEVAGSLIFSLTSGAGNPTTTGTFAAGAIKNINHAAVGLFYQKRADTFPQDASYASSHSTEAEQVLIKSYDTAYAKIQSLYGVSLGKGSKRPGASYWTPYLWDARGRGFGTATDTGTDGWKKGFQDGTNPHFNTPYNTVWQVEAITNTGVSVNNNPFGKTMFTPSIEVKPIYPNGDITIKKTEDGTGTPLSGAAFTLYEWSKASGTWKTSANYKIAESSTAGTYTVYNKSTGNKDYIEINEDNMGRVRVEETTAPHGFNNKDASNNTLAWEHTFPTDVFTTQSWTIDAVNQPLKVGFVVYKHRDDDTSIPVGGATFRLYSDEACTTTIADASGNSSFVTNATTGKFGLSFKLKSTAQTYYLKEYAAPSDYRLNTDTFRISIAGAATGTITVDRKPSGGSWTNVKTISYADAIAMTSQANVPETPKYGDLVIEKTLSSARPGTFWFKITGPEYPSGTWRSISFGGTETTKSITLSEIKPGSYTVTEVTANNSNTPVTSSDAFPWTATGTGTVTVNDGVAVKATWINTLDTGSLQITKNLVNTTDGGTFWFMVTGPDASCPKWISITLAAGETSKSEIITVLVRGSYTVTEVTGDGSTTPVTTSASFPYSFTPATTVSVTKGGTAKVTMTNTEQPGSLTIEKKLTKQPGTAQTFWFHVVCSANSYDSYTSVTVGGAETSHTATLTGLKKGTYTVTEVVANGDPTPFTSGTEFKLITGNEKAVSVKPLETGSVSFTNEEFGSLTVKKSLSDALDADYSFWLKIENSSGYKVWKKITIPAGNTSGQVVLSGIPTGAYTVTEVTGDNSDTAVASSDAFPFDVPPVANATVTRGGSASVTVTNVPQRGSLQIQKSLSSAMDETHTFWFYITGPDNYKNWTSVTMAAGATSGASPVIANLLRGQYTVTEVTADGSTTAVVTSPSFPFAPVPASTTVSVVKGVTAPAAFTNNVPKGSLTITKKVTKAVDADTTFWFLLEGPSESESKKQWIDITVLAGDTTASKTIDSLLIGSYTLKEVDADGSTTEVSLSDAFPYIASGDGAVTITDGAISTAEWENDYRFGNLKIEKVDTEGDHLSGIEFTMYEDAGETVEIGKLITDASGFATSELFLIPSSGKKIYVRETKTDSSHVLGTTELYVVDLVPNSTVLVSGSPISNPKISGKIGITKTGESFDGYTETTTDFGVLKTPTFKQANLAGVKFLVFKASDVTVHATEKTVDYDASLAVCAVTSTDSEVFTPELPLGTYVVVEHEVPTGFEKVQYVGTVTLRKQNEVTTIVVEHLEHKNMQAQTEVAVYKEAEVMVTTTSGETITTSVQLQPGEGFIFGVFAAEDFVGDAGTISAGDMVLLGSTSTDGRIDFTTKLPLGKYILKELKAKDGYEENTEEYPIDLVATGTETLIRVTPLPGGDPIINTLRKKKVKITKMNLAGDTPLPGTRIQVYDEDGHVIFDQVTGEDGSIPEFYALYGRSYTFKEQYAPNGYAILTAVLSFSISDTGEVLGTTEIRDDVNRIVLHKVDDKGNPLAGVEFTLYDLEELPIQVAVSDENGLVTFEEIAYGDYVIVETKPAEGMTLSDWKLELHVDGTFENAEVPIVVINNRPPQTGKYIFEKAPMTYVLIFLFALLFAGIVFIGQVQKKREEESLVRAFDDMYGKDE